MNPNTVYRAMMKNAKSENWTRAARHATALLEWMSHPGTKGPDGYSRAEASQDAHWVLRKAETANA